MAHPQHFVRENWPWQWQKIIIMVNILEWLPECNQSLLDSWIIIVISLDCPLKCLVVGYLDDVHIYSNEKWKLCADMQQIPSSLAVLAEISCGIGGNFSKWSRHFATNPKWNNLIFVFSSCIACGLGCPTLHDMHHITPSKKICYSNIELIEFISSIIQVIKLVSQ